MNNFLKSLITLGVTTAIGFSPTQAATYKVIDAGNTNSHKFTSAQRKNNSDVTVISGSQVYNIPVRFDLLTDRDFNAIESLARIGNEQNTLLADIQDSAALRAGNPTANDFSWVVQYLQQKKNISNSLLQKIGTANVMVNINGETSEVTIFDENLSNGILSRSTTDFVNGVSNESWIYGNATAPYLPFAFTDSSGNEVTHWVRDFTTRGFVTLDNGNTIKQIIPPESRFGGESALLDMNDNRFGVGYASSSIKESVLNTIESTSGGCADPNVLKNKPFEVCVWELRTSMYSLQAMLFQFDGQGNVISSESLGNLVTPNVDDTRVFKSYAQAINNNNVVVGFAHGWQDAAQTKPSRFESRSFYAVMYKDGKAISFSKDHRKEFDSRAYDINDAGIAVGHVNKFVNGSQRTKFYYVDTNTADLTMVFPDDFFSGSSSTARAINEQGFIVGEGEVETHNDTQRKPRRRHGFLYDINTDTFTDLNDFLSCDSAYNIVEARDINDFNEISATAVVKVPRHDAYGQLEFDKDGNQLKEDVIRAVTLQPIAGKIEDCSSVKGKIKRKGASFGWFSLLLLVPIAFRRKYQK